MQYKLILLVGIFLIIFSIQSFGQDSTYKSAHPKMDKYYPRPQKTQVLDNNAEATPAKPITSTSQAPVMATAPAPTNTVASPPVPTVTAPTPPPEPQIEVGPAVTSTPVEPSGTKLNSSNSVSAPATVTVTTPVPKTVSQPKAPPAPPYMDTRLGSSSPQYDTWEKNNNGAGSVTTNSKQIDE